MLLVVKHLRWKVYSLNETCPFAFHKVSMDWHAVVKKCPCKKLIYCWCFPKLYISYFIYSIHLKAACHKWTIAGVLQSRSILKLIQKIWPPPNINRKDSVTDKHAILPTEVSIAIQKMVETSSSNARIQRTSSKNGYNRAVKDANDPQLTKSWLQRDPHCICNVIRSRHSNLCVLF